MNDLIKFQWMTALMSGEYSQGREMLHDEEGNFCCLGVLTDLYCAEKNKKWVEAEADFCFGIEGEQKEYYVLPNVVAYWAGLSSLDPLVNGVQIAALNDSGSSFKKIAKLIDEYF